MNRMQGLHTYTCNTVHIHVQGKIRKHEYLFKKLKNYYYYIYYIHVLLYLQRHVLLLPPLVVLMYRLTNGVYYVCMRAVRELLIYLCGHGPQPG